MSKAEDFRRVTLMVDGHEVEADAGELRITDVSSGMDTVASVMAYWGSVWAAAEAESKRVDSHYRAWRAEFGKQILEANPKAAEWKVKQEIESSPKFGKYKEAIAQADRNSLLLKTRFESLKTMGSMLQSKGAMMRSELDSTSMSTRERGGDPEKAARGADAMREANKGKGGRRKRKAVE